MGAEGQGRIGAGSAYLVTVELLLKLAAWIFGRLFGSSPAPSAEAVQAKEVGTVTAQLDNSEAANAELSTAADARAASDAARVHADTTQTDPSAHWRD